MQHTCDHIVIEGDGRAYRPCLKRGNQDIDGFHFCTLHSRVYTTSRERWGVRPADRCHVIGRLGPAGCYCPNEKFPGHSMCQRHLPPDLGGPDRVERVWRTWTQANIRAALANPNIRVHRFEDWAGAGLDGRPQHAALLGPPPDVIPFHLDKQNVHRREVSEQTNKATQFLLKFPQAVNPWKEICAKLLDRADNNMRVYINVLDDIQKWLATASCRKENDHLYRRLFYSLVTYINTYLTNSKPQEYRELWNRVWQECVDSVGMCCEGHISRLCNVLVGYVEGLDPPVPLGELIQQRMSAIASQEIPEEEKRVQANAFFDEHKVPEADRTAWLEAF